MNNLNLSEIGLFLNEQLEKALRNILGDLLHVTPVFITCHITKNCVATLLSGYLQIYNIPIRIFFHDGMLAESYPRAWVGRRSVLEASFFHCYLGCFKVHGIFPHHKVALVIEQSTQEVRLYHELNRYLPNK